MSRIAQEGRRTNTRDNTPTGDLHFVPDGSGPVTFEPSPASDWDGIPDRLEAPDVTRVDLDRLDTAQVAGWRTGQTLLPSGRVLTARNATHKRLVDLLGRGQDLPVDLHGRVIHYVVPVDAMAVGPAGHTTATRMDRFVDTLLAQTGLLAMMGKAERGPEAIRSIRRHGAALPGGGG